MPPAPPRRAPWQPRFTILGLLLTTLVVSVGAAGVSYLVRAQGQGRLGHLIFLLITLVGPLLLVVCVSLIRAAALALHRPAKSPRDDESLGD